ncbi:MAG: DegT/DnrJ/EryC1/StrS family aminotransferase [SAR324 cluster bacterium]|nr:DegT/DnrJ/EryC1/StrS family aminotransferase [SAR324 cluster bacterium]
MKTFKGRFTQQESIPEEGIQRALEVLRSGRLHRYNVIEDEVSEVNLLESEFARYQGAKFCLACASGGYAMQVALTSFGLKHGEPVLTNAFTLSPVPGAICNAGGKPVLVETTDQLVIDLSDLEQKIESSGSRVLLLSHMRGHIADMDRMCQLLEKKGVQLIEDCAHTMGAAWGGKKSGSFGLAACFSTQTYKHINSGEGGFITTDDPELIARAIIRSGSYMLYDRHDASPEASYFTNIRLDTPNCSGRMDNLRAAILRPQLRILNENGRRWNERYRLIEEILSNAVGVTLPVRPHVEEYVGSSIQFLLMDMTEKQIKSVIRKCLDRGVELKWFGAPEPAGYTSRHDSWRYIESQTLPNTDRILSKMLDMRIPLTFSLDDCRLIGGIIMDCISEVRMN